MGQVLAQSESRNAINVSVQMIFAQTNVPQRFPAYCVPPGLLVGLRGNNGTSLNGNNCYVGRYPEQLTGAGRMTIAPTMTTQVSYPVDNMCEIWAMGTAGDGLIASVASAAIG